MKCRICHTLTKCQFYIKTTSASQFSRNQRPCPGTLNPIQTKRLECTENTNNTRAGSQSVKKPLHYLFFLHVTIHKQKTDYINKKDKYALNLHFAAAIAFILMLILLAAMALMKRGTNKRVYGGV